MYCAYITRIENLRKHPNADRLLIGSCFGNNVVVSSSYEPNTIGVYFPSDGQIGIEYATANKLLRSQGGYLDDSKRNVKALKLRGERSDGLFLPIESLEEFTDVTTLPVGTKIDVLNGIEICRKYTPESDKPFQDNKRRTSKKNALAKCKYPYFKEHADTLQLAYNIDKFKVGDVIYITEKLHGTSQRTARTYRMVASKRFGWLRRLFRLPLKWKQDICYISGTRRRILTDNHSGFYGDELFRKEAASKFDGKLEIGEEVFYEIVGYTETGKPLMGTYNTAKAGDTEFTKKYGTTFDFSYGCLPGHCEVYVYRMTLTNQDGYVVEYSTEQVIQRCKQIGVNYVPIIDVGVVTESNGKKHIVSMTMLSGDLLHTAKTYSRDCDIDARLASSRISDTNPCEGVVVRIDNRPEFTAFKHKNFIFKCLEGIAKEGSSSPDIEESEEA